MITLDKTVLQLRAEVGGNVTTQPLVNISFYDENRAGGETRHGSKQTPLNHSNAVIICVSPPENYARNIETLSIYNGDSASQSTAVYVYDTAASTSTMVVKQTLATSQSMIYSTDAGWQKF